MRERTEIPWGCALRSAEKVLLGFFGYVIVASLISPLPIRQRLLVTGLNLLSGSTVLALSRRGADPRLAALRDWLPCALIILAYRESGLFFAPDPTHRLDRLFESWDNVILGSRSVEWILSAAAPWLEHYLELSYLLCYPLVPLGLGSLVLARRSGALDEARGERAISCFWSAVVLGLMFCYVVYPLFPLTPPRTLYHDVPGPVIRPLFRKLNGWVLGQYSVQACIFPSGHVAAVTATALSVRAVLPRLGVVFLVAAASVAVATVYGRYHYAPDALAGALVGLASFALSRRLR